MKYDEILALIRREIETAVAAEREACAQIVEAPHWKPAVRAVLKQRATAIRARGEK
jgi:hypothetical protein